MFSGRSKLAIGVVSVVMISLLVLTALTYWQFNKVIETELIDTMAARTAQSASHIDTWLKGQLGEVQATVNSPQVDRILRLNPGLDLTRNDESVQLMDELNLARGKYVASAYPEQYAALHIINYLEADEWAKPENLNRLKARYYNVKERTCRTDLWAQAAADEAGQRYGQTGGVYDAIFKPAYSQAYGRNMVLILAWRKDNQGRALAGAASSLTIETIQHIARGATYGKKGYEILLAQDGTFVTHPNAAWSMKEKALTVPDENMQALGRLAAGAVPGMLRFNDSGERKIAFFNPIPVAGWTLISVVDESELFIPANKLLVLMVAIAAILIIFTLMAAYIAMLVVNLKRSRTAREELKARNVELNAAKERLRQQNIVLEEARQHLINLDKMKDEFLAKVSHELKTPLHGIIGLAQCTQDGLVGQSLPEAEKSLDLIVKSGARLANLVDEIADFSILKNNQVHLNRKPFQLRDIVQMVITLEQFFIQNKEVRLENNIAANTPLVYADSERLMQIFHNLIRNAIKFTDYGRITVSAEAADGQVSVSVTDTGIGIAKERLDAIFNPFEQGEQGADRTAGGLGLGLSITQSLLKLHQSTLQVVSEEGRGSCFSFLLPQWNGQGEFGPEPASPIGSVVLPAGPVTPEYGTAELPREERPGVKKILVVDDEEVNLAVIKGCFKGLNYRAVCVKNGREALLELERDEYQLVLLDMMMPGLNGIEICREIRKTYTANSLIVIMVTVRNRPEDIACAFMAQANDYITKPFYKQELLSRVQAHLRAQEAYETERKVYQAEIAALQAQIQPHFLYNTLNTILSFCRTNPGKAAEILEELSDFLQNKFRFNTMTFIPLKQELELVQSYLTIEQVRFGKRLQVEFHMDPAADDILIPPLILQPLVENAVKHGICQKREGGKITITVQRLDQETLLMVADDGAGMPPAHLEQILAVKNAQEVGVGLPNIHKRLQKHYGQGLDMQSSPESGTVVTVHIPNK